MSRWLLRILLPISAACALTTAAAPLSADQPPVDPRVEPRLEPLDQLLSRLGLVELRLHRLERSLAAETDGGKRLALARQLADRYAEQLVAAADEPAQFGRWQQRVAELLTQLPEAKTPALEVVLWQAEYQRAEALLLRWQDEPSDKPALAEAAQTLARLAPQLTERRSELAAAAEKTSEAIEALATAPERAAAEQQLQKQQAAAARAGYFAGWAHYYLGVARQNPLAARGDFAAAKEQFLIVLDVSDDKDYEPVEADGLGLESSWRARAVIGLGLSELGLGRTAPAARVLAWLQQPAAPAGLREQAAYWQLQGMLNGGLVEEAARFTAAEIAGFSGAATPGKCSLAVAAVRGGAALAEQQAAARPQLIADGLRGLAQLRQFETLDKLIEKHRLETVLGGQQFTLAWLRGRGQYLAAEKSKSADDFRTAAASLTAALARPEAQGSLAEAGQVRYYLGWCQFRLGELAVAARTFHEAATALRPAAPDLASQAAWMQATCLVTLAAKDKSQVASAVTALQNFQQEFPSSEQAGRAELLVTRLRQSHVSPVEAIRELAAIKPGDVNYVSAQYEIAQLQHQQWLAAKSDPAKAAPLAADLLKTADRFLASAERGGDHLRRLRVALLACDALLAAAAPDDARLRSLLAGAAAAAAHVEPEHPAVSEFQYRRLQAAQRAGDPATVQAAADAIAKHGGGSPYALPALVIVARAADAAAAAAQGSDRNAKQDEAIRVYRRLAELLGESPAALAENKNALAVASKLAAYDEERGRWKEAAQRLALLVEALPKDRRLLRRAALAAYQSGDFAAALNHWRTLLAGATGGSSDWLEAKYYQLACLSQTDRAAAKKVYDQFKLLYPDVKSPEWKGKFAEFEKL